MTPDELREEASRVLDTCVEELTRAGSLRPGALIVLGCSTSEVAGARIGRASVPEFGLVIAQSMLSVCFERGLHPVFQCCEHLNRALVMEQSVQETLRLTRVHAVPRPKAGGSVPTGAWKLLASPVLVQAVQADAAIDVGDTFVGMHIRPVAVPLRGTYSALGQAHLTMAYSRWPLIGGERAAYTEETP